jgi:predicted RNA-binding protein with PUA-like domain
VAKISKVAFDDPTQFDPKSDYYDAKASKEKPRWSCVEVSFHKTLKRPFSLEDLRANKTLRTMLILRPGNRLSVTPVSAQEFKAIAGS